MPPDPLGCFFKYSLFQTLPSPQHIHQTPFASAVLDSSGGRGGRQQKILLVLARSCPPMYYSHNPLVLAVIWSLEHTATDIDPFFSGGHECKNPRQIIRDGELLAMTTVDLLIADAHRVLLCGNNSRLCCCWPKVGWLNRWKSHKRDGRESTIVHFPSSYSSAFPWTCGIIDERVHGVAARARGCLVLHVVCDSPGHVIPRRETKARALRSSLSMFKHLLSLSSALPIFEPPSTSPLFLHSATRPSCSCCIPNATSSAVDSFKSATLSHWYFPPTSSSSLYLTTVSSFIIQNFF